VLTGNVENPVEQMCENCVNKRGLLKRRWDGSNAGSGDEETESRTRKNVLG